MATTVEIPDALRDAAKYDPAAHKGITRADAIGKAASDGTLLSIAADAAIYSYTLEAWISAECELPAFGTRLVDLVESEAGGRKAADILSTFGHPDTQKILLGAALLYAQVGDGSHTDWLVRSPDARSGDMAIPPHLTSRYSLYKVVDEWVKSQGKSVAVAVTEFITYLDDASPEVKAVRKDTAERKVIKKAEKAAKTVTPTELKDNAPTATDWLRKASKIVAGLNVDGHAEAWQEFVAAVEAKRKAVEATTEAEEASE